MASADELDRDVREALGALDDVVPSASVDAIIARARARAGRRRTRVAVAATVMLAASAAAALPGSPVRRWISAALGDAALPTAAPIADQVPPASLPIQAELRGVVTYVGDSAEVLFSAAQDSGFVLIRFVPEAQLRIRSADSSVGYQIRPRGILVNNEGSRASYELDVAERASNVRVAVMESGRTRVVFERRAGRDVIGPAQRADGTYPVSLVPGR